MIYPLGHTVSTVGHFNFQHIPGSIALEISGYPAFKECHTRLVIGFAAGRASGIKPNGVPFRPAFIVHMYIAAAGHIVQNILIQLKAFSDFDGCLS